MLERIVRPQCGGAEETGGVHAHSIAREAAPRKTYPAGLRIFRQ
jgi:hypothetical protein